MRILLIQLLFWSLHQGDLFAKDRFSDSDIVYFRHKDEKCIWTVLKLPTRETTDLIKFDTACKKAGAHKNKHGNKVLAVVQNSAKIYQLWLLDFSEGALKKELLPTPKADEIEDFFFDENDKVVVHAASITPSSKTWTLMALRFDKGEWQTADVQYANHDQSLNQFGDTHPPVGLFVKVKMERYLPQEIEPNFQYIRCSKGDSYGHSPKKLGEKLMTFLVNTLKSRRNSAQYSRIEACKGWRLLFPKGDQYAKVYFAPSKQIAAFADPNRRGDKPILYFDFSKNPNPKDASKEIEKYSFVDTDAEFAAPGHILLANAIGEAAVFDMRTGKPIFNSNDAIFVRTWRYLNKESI